MRNEKITPDPASCADAAAVRTNRPAPITAPMPRAIRLFAVSVRFRVLWLARSSSDSRDFLRVRLIRYPDRVSKPAGFRAGGFGGAPKGTGFSRPRTRISRGQIPVHEFLKIAVRVG